MTARLARFAIEADGDYYRLRMTLADGTILNVSASFDQLDELGEEIDRRLDADQDMPQPEF